MFEAGLSDECPMVRMWSTRGLCDFQMIGCSHDGLEVALQRMLRDEEDVGGGRNNAIYLLGKLGCHTPDTIAALVDMLADGDPTNRACAADSLGMIGSPNGQSAVPALKRLVEDEERLVRDAALTALRKITGSP
jgi:HEAT repeat protein